MFSLGIEVTGLNDTGSLAAALAPGAQSLVNAQVGTWRQRMGVVPAVSNGGVAPWVRVFSDSGDVDARAQQQLRSGRQLRLRSVEQRLGAGPRLRPSDQFAVGVLMAESEGSQHLTDGRRQRRLDGRTFGIYGTWLANGFYLDAS